MEADWTPLYSILHKRVGFEVRSQSRSEQQLRLLARIPPNNMTKWLSIMNRLFEEESEQPWSLDISKQYFRRGDRVIYAWRVIIQGPELETHLKTLVRLIASAPQPTNEVTTKRLPGRWKEDRNVPVRGRGAQSVLHARVGPSYSQ